MRADEKCRRIDAFSIRQLIFLSQPSANFADYNTGFTHKILKVEPNKIRYTVRGRNVEVRHNNPEL